MRGPLSFQNKKGSLIIFAGVLCLLLSNAPAVYAQDSTGIKRQKIGFVAAYGTQNIFPFDLPKYDDAIQYTYKVVFLQAQYYYSFTKKKNWGFEALVQPQYNFVTYRPIDSVPSERKALEFGVNAGLLIRRNFMEGLFSIYGFISAGPHYVSGVPARQVPGFIFSDNFFAGVNVRVHKDFYADIRYGYRHISNAEIKRPNGGIDNVILGVGMYMAF